MLVRVTGLTFSSDASSPRAGSTASSCPCLPTCLSWGSPRAGWAFVRTWQYSTPFPSASVEGRSIDPNLPDPMDVFAVQEACLTSFHPWLNGNNQVLSVVLSILVIASVICGLFTAVVWHRMSFRSTQEHDGGKEVISLLFLMVLVGFDLSFPRFMFVLLFPYLSSSRPFSLLLLRPVHPACSLVNQPLPPFFVGKERGIEMDRHKGFSTRAFVSGRMDPRGEMGSLATP